MAKLMRYCPSCKTHHFASPAEWKKIDAGGKCHTPKLRKPK
jgi:hypothetical protein